MADNDRPDHQQRILELLNRRQGPQRRQQQMAAEGGQNAPLNPEVQQGQAAAGANNLPPVGGDVAHRADGIALLEAQIEAVRLQVAAGDAPEALQRVLQRAEATLARQQAELANIQARQAEEEQDRQPRRLVVVPNEPNNNDANDGRRRMHLNAADLGNMFVRKSTPIYERLEALMRYSEINRLTHEWIMWCIPYALTDAELQHFDLVRDLPLQDAVDHLITMFIPRAKDKKYYENLIQNFVRPAGEVLKATMTRFGHLCRKAMEKAPPAAIDGFWNRYAESALFHLTTVDTRKALKRFLKEKEMNGEHVTMAELTTQAERIEELEGWVPSCDMSMADAHVKGVFVARKTSRESSPEIMREKRRSDHEERRREKRRESQERGRVTDQNFQEMERPIKTRSDTPAPDSFRPPSPPRSRKETSTDRARYPSSESRRQDYAPAKPRNYSRGRSLERRSSSSDTRRRASYDSSKRYNGSDSRRRSFSRGRERYRSSSPINEFLSANIKNLIIGADLGRFELMVRCKKCKRDAHSCKCRQE